MKLINKIKDKWNLIDKDKLKERAETTIMVGINATITYIVCRIVHNHGIKKGLDIYNEFIVKTVLEHPEIEDPLLDAMNETLSNMQEI